jgi:hypothetical protein
MASLTQLACLNPTGHIRIGEVVEDDLFSQEKELPGSMGQAYLDLGSMGYQPN